MITGSNMWDVALRVVDEALAKALAEDKGWGELEDAKRLISFHRNSNLLTLYKAGDRDWSWDGLTVALHIEKLQGERSRVVVDMSDMAAEELQHKFGIMRVPAPLDATEAIVRATHSLASATDKLTDVLDKLATTAVPEDVK